MFALAVALIGLGAGASPSLAAPGRVYFDDDDNVAAGETLFNEASPVPSTSAWAAG